MFNKKDIIILTSLVEKELNSKKYLTDSYIKNLENLNSKLEGYLQYLEDEGCQDYLMQYNCYLQGHRNRLKSIPYYMLIIIYFI